MSHVLVNPVFAVIGTFGVRLLSVVGACLLLGAGCASQAIGYRPVGADGFGYSGGVSDDGTVKVSFRGNGRNTVQQARKYALCRAAEIAAGQGFSLMAVADEDGEDKFSGTYENCVKNYYTGQTSCYESNIYRPVATVVVRGFMLPSETKGEPLSVSEHARACVAGKN